jgi:ankyrin repeat protein
MPQTPLHTFARDGDLAGVRKHIHLAGKHDPLFAGYTALIYAAENNHPDCVQVLRSRELGLTNQHLTSAFFRAVYCGHPVSARLLLDEGRARNKYGYYALDFAATNSFAGSAECLRLCLPREYDLVQELRDLSEVAASSEQRAAVAAFVRFRHLTAEQAALLPDQEQPTAYRIAAQCNLHAVLSVLAPRCAGHRFHGGTTALIYATAEGHHEAIAMLAPLEAGLVDNSGWSALRVALALGDAQAVAMVGPSEFHTLESVEHGFADYTSDAATSASASRLLDTYRGFTAADADIVLGSCGESAKQAYCACLSLGRLEVATRLGLGLQHARFCAGATALMMAAQHDAGEVVAALAPSQAGLLDPLGRSALHLARAAGKVRAATVLFDFEFHTIDLDLSAPTDSAVDAVFCSLARDPAHLLTLSLRAVAPDPPHYNQAETLALWAAECCAPAPLTHLVPFLSAEPGERTPLMIAAANPDAFLCVELLAESQAGIVDASGWSALRHACAAGNLRAIERLFDAEFHTLDLSRHRPIDLATDNAAIAQLESLLTDKVRWARLARELLTAPLHSDPRLAALFSIATDASDAELAGLLAARLQGSRLAFKSRTHLMRAVTDFNQPMVEVLAPFEAGLVDADALSALAHACACGNASAAAILAPYELPTLFPLADGPLSRFPECQATLEAGVLKYSSFSPSEAVNLVAAPVADVKDAFLGCLAFANAASAIALAPRLGELRFARDRTALMLAARFGLSDAVEELAPRLSGLRDADGWSALMHACQARHFAAVACLAQTELGLKAPSGVGPSDLWKGRDADVAFALGRQANRLATALSRATSPLLADIAALRERVAELEATKGHVESRISPLDHAASAS